jgi:hypothetical protein
LATHTVTPPEKTAAKHEQHHQTHQISSRHVPANALNPLVFCVE